MLELDSYTDTRTAFTSLGWQAWMLVRRLRRTQATAQKVPEGTEPSGKVWEETPKEGCPVSRTSEAVRELGKLKLYCAVDQPHRSQTPCMNVVSITSSLGTIR